jgi:hypothetical protein
MSGCKVRLPLPEMNDFLSLDPSPEEIDGVIDCLKLLKSQPEDGTDIPFGQYSEYERCRVFECGRFEIVYTYSEAELEIVEILPGSDYPD